MKNAFFYSKIEVYPDMLRDFPGGMVHRNELSGRIADVSWKYFWSDDLRSAPQPHLKMRSLVDFHYFEDF